MIEKRVWEHRPCPACGEERKVEVLREITCGDTVPYLPARYQLAQCGRCGLLYADTAATDRDYNRYYQENNFYGNGERLQNVETCHQEEFSGVILNMIRAEAGVEDRILDVGFGGGGTLAQLQELGYRRLKGIDPARESVEHLQGFGIEGVQKSVYDAVDPSDKNQYDLVLLQSVLEHLLYPRDALANLLDYLKPEGKLFLVVPALDDIQDFSNGIAANFNIEHINYFTSVSLRNLLASFGMRLLVQQAYLRPGGEGGVLYAMFQRGPVEQPSVEEEYLALQRKKLDAYFHGIDRNESRLQQQIQDLVARKTPCVIWGAGARTRRLLATTRIREANIAAILDSNHDKWGTEIEGIPVSAPGKTDFGGKQPLFLICVNYQWVAEEIRQQIEQLYHGSDSVIL